MQLKSYTDLEQSKKLVLILPVESADMFYKAGNDTQPTFRLHSYGHIMFDKDVCAWSLAALLDFLKDKIVFGCNSPEGWFCCFTIKNPTKVLTIYGDSLVNACVAVIEKLHELNLL